MSEGVVHCTEQASPPHFPCPAVGSNQVLRVVIW
jgi:hypothetical protein